MSQFVSQPKDTMLDRNLGTLSSVNTFIEPNQNAHIDQEGGTIKTSNFVTTTGRTSVFRPSKTVNDLPAPPMSAESSQMTFLTMTNAKPNESFTSGMHPSILPKSQPNIGGFRTSGSSQGPPADQMPFVKRNSFIGATPGQGTNLSTPITGPPPDQQSIISRQNIGPPSNQMPIITRSNSGPLKATTPKSAFPKGNENPQYPKSAGSFLSSANLKQLNQPKATSGSRSPSRGFQKAMTGTLVPEDNGSPKFRPSSAMNLGQSNTIYTPTNAFSRSNPQVEAASIAMKNAVQKVTSQNNIVKNVQNRPSGDNPMYIAPFPNDKTPADDPTKFEDWQQKLKPTAKATQAGAPYRPKSPAKAGPFKTGTSSFQPSNTFQSPSSRETPQFGKSKGSPMRTSPNRNTYNNSESFSPSNRYQKFGDSFTFAGGDDQSKRSSPLPVSPTPQRDPRDYEEIQKRQSKIEDLEEKLRKTEKENKEKTNGLNQRISVLQDQLEKKKQEEEAASEIEFVADITNFNPIEVLEQIIPVGVDADNSDNIEDLRECMLPSTYPMMDNPSVYMPRLNGVFPVHRPPPMAVADGDKRIPQGTAMTPLQIKQYATDGKLSLGKFSRDYNLYIDHEGNEFYIDRAKEFAKWQESEKEYRQKKVDIVNRNPNIPMAVTSFFRNLAGVA